MKFKEKIICLCEAIASAFSEDDEMKTHAYLTLEQGLNSFCAYVAAVYTMETTLPILRFTKEGEDYRDCVAALDRSRRNAHESAISACSFLDRLCTLAGLDWKFFGGDPSDRYAVADFCMDCVTEVFGDRAGQASSVKLSDIIPNLTSEGF